MKEPARCLRLPPCPHYDVEGMESWLSDMAAKGWRLEPDDFFFGLASFSRTEPGPVRYRLEASLKRVSTWDADGGVPDREARELNEAEGWEYAGRRGEFFIYRTGDPDAPELQTDPRVQAMAVKAVEKRRTASLIILLVELSVIWLLYALKGASLLLGIAMTGLSFLLPLELVVLLGLGILFAELRYLRRLRRKLLAGSPPDRKKDWRSVAIWYHAAHGAFWLLLILYAVLSLRILGVRLEHRDRTPLADYTGTPPFATIADFAEGTYTETWADVNFDYVSQWSNVFLHTGMEWGEHAEVRRADGSRLEGGLYVDYFEARSEWLAKRIAAEYRRVVKARAGKTYEPLTLPDLGLDEASACRDVTHHPTVVLRKGNTVVRAMFYQTGEDERLPLEEWAAIMADSIR